MKKLLHALEQGASEVHVRTVDSDIITILIEKFHEIQKYFPSINLIVAFDIGKTFFLLQHQVFVAILGKMLVNISAFKNKGKLMGWQVWKSFKDLTDTFKYLAQNPFTLPSNHFSNILVCCESLCSQQPNIISE